MNDDKIPYAYAIENNILFDSSKSCILFNEKTSIDAIMEVNRYVSSAHSLKKLPPAEFDTYASNYYSGLKISVNQTLEGMDEVMNLDEVAQTLEQEKDLLEADDGAPIIRLLNSIFFEALKCSASDIHIEPYEDTARIRYRVNGVLITILTPHQRVIPLLISRIKVLAKLDIAEKRIPQDGRVSVLLGGRQVDLRISSLPSSYGERIVLRLLDKSNQQIDLEHLGMDIDNVARFELLIQRPHGIILVTGPTGSGKTTTLYAALQRMDRHQNNILTVEDPIEYDLPGISQTQVNTKTGMTFSKSLRAILRQDPDVILIGEIRDKETADIAIQASLTGHLVLATLHTNSASGTITRLQDLGIDRFLLASTIRGIVAQRLVRQLCAHCKEKATTQGYHAKGCSHCNDTGFDGRKGIFELVTLDTKMQEMIHTGCSEPELETIIRQKIPSIHQIGMLMVEEGTTSLEEVVRVTSN